MKYIGIDPGKSGGIAVLSDVDCIKVAAMPTDKSNEIICSELSELLKDADFVVLEDVHSIFGMSAQSNFQFGRVLGIVEGVLGTLNKNYVRVTPKVWQKEVWGTVEPKGTLTGKLLKSGKPHIKIDTKATSLIVAQQLFPDVNLLATSRSKVPHDGIVDSLLIAEYCRRMFTDKLK
jgi:hypothetical protein